MQPGMDCGRPVAGFWRTLVLQSLSALLARKERRRPSNHTRSGRSAACDGPGFVVCYNMVNAKELVERFGGAPQVLPKTQDELRREVERLRIEVELAQRGGLGEDEHLTVDMVLPP